MNPPQISLASLLLFSAAAPLWIYVTVGVAGGPGFDSPLRWIVIPGLLLATTWAIHRLLPKHPIRWGLAALLAGIIPLGLVIAVAIYVANLS